VNHLIVYLINVIYKVGTTRVKSVADGTLRGLIIGFALPKPQSSTPDASERESNGTLICSLPDASPTIGPSLDVAPVVEVPEVEDSDFNFINLRGASDKAYPVKQYKVEWDGGVKGWLYREQFVRLKT